MVEFSFEEATALLKKNLENAKENLKSFVMEDGIVREELESEIIRIEVFGNSCFSIKIIIFTA